MRGWSVSPLTTEAVQVFGKEFFLERETGDSVDDLQCFAGFRGSVSVQDRSGLFSSVQVALNGG